MALIGNPNTGKTSLLNALTGMSLHVGNWPGKTMEKMEGRLSHMDRDLRIVDLPGSYSTRHWTFAVALIFGVVAKEVILGTLGALYEVGSEGLAAAVAARLSPGAGLAFLFFVLLYIPCLATMAVMRKESGSWKPALLQPAFTFLVAWVTAFGVYHAARWLGLG